MDPRSPERYARQRDEECGLADAAAAALGDEGEITCEDDAFDIPAKNAPVERLHRWRFPSWLDVARCNVCCFDGRRLGFVCLDRLTCKDRGGFPCGIRVS
ncbi:hypothetical protein C4D60_Mb10t25950 [Musa balbisiana]|uniref:Calcium-transporting P-type ATPase N-terminal autoinhibitory domain-containing protein n=1 Tax=Musa balbisiana TaxID=52838 RepID=A0A4S8IZS4_MUSBA|nr:hypothetical protein C4D60_Mb10t25950 [Musa balbisiana]